MEKYIEFIGESKADTSSAKEGDFIFFSRDIVDYKGVGGNVAKIEKIEPIKDKKYAYGGANSIYYVLKFERPIQQSYTITKKNIYGYNENEKKWEEVDTIGIIPQNLRDFEIVPPEYLEGVKTGKLTKYRCSGLFEFILKAMKFKVKAKYCDASFFDIDREKDDAITFVPANRIKDVKEDPNDDYAVYKATKGRQSSKIGRVLKKLNPDLTDPQVENFVAEYKAAWSAKMEHINDRLRVVIGEDIQYWYLNKRYAKGGGSLNQSCMQGSDAQNGIAFYANNPNSIALAILLDDDDKLVARALIWRCSTPSGMIFMDRIYSVKPQHDTIMKNFARDNGIVAKAGSGIVYGYQGKRMEVHVKPWSGQWPYLDTFHYDHNKKIMTAG